MYTGISAAIQQYYTIQVYQQLDNSNILYRYISSYTTVLYFTGISAATQQYYTLQVYQEWLERLLLAEAEIYWGGGVAAFPSPLPDTQIILGAKALRVKFCITCLMLFLDPASNHLSCFLGLKFKVNS